MKKFTELELWGIQRQIENATGVAFPNPRPEFFLSETKGKLDICHETIPLGTGMMMYVSYSFEGATEIEMDHRVTVNAFYLN